MRERTIWIAAGLLGLVVAVALAMLTSSVSQPPVGAPGEPVSAGRQLAPARTTTPTTVRPARPAGTATSTTPAPPAAQTPPQDDDDASDSSGSGFGDDSSGRGRGRGRGGDD